MCYAVGEFIQAKKAFIAVTGYKCCLPNEIWPRLSYVFPFSADSVIHERNPEIDLEVMPSIVFVVISSPSFFTNPPLC
jgi:hypothetical protein